MQQEHDGEDTDPLIGLVKEVEGIVATAYDGPEKRPGGDLEYFVAFDTGEHLALMPASEWMTDNDRMRTFGTVLMPKAAEKLDARRFAFAAPTWGVSVEDDATAEVAEAERARWQAWAAENPGGDMGDYPHRTEWVKVIYGEWTGKLIVRRCRVTRDAAGVPSIGPWYTEENTHWRESAHRGVFVTAVMNQITGRAAEGMRQIRAVIDEIPEFESILYGAIEELCAKYEIPFDREHPFDHATNSGVAQHVEELIEMVIARSASLGEEKVLAIGNAIEKQNTINRRDNPTEGAR